MTYTGPERRNDAERRALIARLDRLAIDASAVLRARGYSVAAIDHVDALEELRVDLIEGR